MIILNANQIKIITLDACRVNFQRCLHSKMIAESRLTRHQQLLLRPALRPVVESRRGLTFQQLVNLINKLRMKPDRGVSHNYAQDGMNRSRNILVYRGEYNRYTSFAALGTLLFATVAFIYIQIRNKYFPERRDLDRVSPVDLKSEKYLIYGVLAYHGLMIVTAKRWVLRIYYDEMRKVFTLSYHKWYNPFRTNRYECRAGDAVRLDHRFTHLLGNTRINWRMFMIVESSFRFPVYFNMLYGYSNPDVIDSLKDNPEREFRKEPMKNKNLVAYKKSV